jgi:hypothetical protein
VAISPPRVIFALVLSFTAGKGESLASSPAATASTAPGQAASAKCPLPATALDTLTPYRWEVAQYQADRGFIGGIGIRVDMCELIGKDDKGRMKTGVMVNIAKGVHADAFARHWRAACAESIMPDARGTVQPVPGVPGGQQCLTPKGRSSHYWIEAPGRTIQIEGENDAVEWAEIFPQILAAAARP